jgi:PST family polysaccharide transporter
MQSIFPAWFFQGIEKMKYIAYINLSTKILFLISLWFVVTNPNDYYLVPLLNGITMMLSVIISFWIIHKTFKIQFHLPKFIKIKSILIEGRHAFLSQFSPTLYNNTTMFILGYTTDNITTGVYASATKLIDAFNSLAVLLSNTFLPYLSRNIQKHEQFSRIMIIIGTILSIFAYSFSEYLIVFFFSEKNMIISHYFELLTPMIFFIFIRFTYGTNYLMLVGEDVKYKNIVLYSCILFFILAIFLVPILKINGAIIIMVGATFLMALLTLTTYIKLKKGIK